MLEMADFPAPKTQRRPAALNDRWIVPGICLFLAVITLAVFGRTFHYGFVNFDDDLYVYENPLVCGGLTLSGVTTVFTHVECNFYHPLTMLSLMLNHQLNGLQPAGYHLVNVLLHTLSSILLFLVLRRMTGFIWRSAFVAAVFAVHPLRVESVAWVAERKDVLSCLFFMLTLWAYACYVRNARSVVLYLVVVILFALGLLCKPNLVTLPFVLLLLDYWPLRRFGGGPVASRKPAGQWDGLRVFARLVVEKVPLFGLSAAAVVIAPIAEGKEMLAPLAGLSFVERMSNPIMSYVIYLRQMVLPAGLTVFYPFSPSNFTGWEIMAALALLATISCIAIAAWRKRPYLLVGWLWYLGMLVPMIGLMQVGGFAHADRFTNLPTIGLCIALTWTAADFCIGWRHRGVVLGGGAIAILMALMFCAYAQTAYWRDSESLWTRALACTSDNFVAHYNLGNALESKGRLDEAIGQYQEAIRLKPIFVEAHCNLGIALELKGQPDQATGEYQEAIRLKPDYAEAHSNLGTIFEARGQLDAAISQYQEAIRLKPDYAQARNNLARVLGTKNAPTGR